ncbi:MAG: hypothetical protein M3347_08740 [Armatimonadota bacterium]|nr:hypothetical protein [Armatimonadota bacterium]
MSALNQPGQDDIAARPVPPVVRYALIGEIKIYMVQEGELDKLAHGSPESVYLNFALALLPISITLAVTLLTTTVQSDRVYQAFLIVCVTTFIIGALLLVLWWRSRQSSKKLIEEIKSRMPPAPGIQEGSGTELRK